MFYTASLLGDLPLTHFCIAHDDQLVIGRITVNKLPGRDFVLEPSFVVLPDTFVQKIMKVIGSQVLKFATSGRKQLGTHVDMFIHRATNVIQHEHLDCIVAFRDFDNIKDAATSRRGADGFLEVQFQISSFPCPAPQAPQRQL